MSTSTATSSSSALSGLAQLIHSHPNPSSPTRGPMTTIKPSFHNNSTTSSSRSSNIRKGLDSELIEMEQKKEVDIGIGAYHSGIKHLTASLNQMKPTHPFR